MLVSGVAHELGAQVTRCFLDTGELLPEPPFSERIRILRRHLDLMVEVFGEKFGCIQFRKVAPWYAKRFGPASVFNKRIVRLESRAEFEEILALYIQWRAPFCDDAGALLPRFRLAPMIASFLQADDSPESTRREAIPVPRGPVEVW